MEPHGISPTPPPPPVPTPPAPPLVNWAPPTGATEPAPERARRPVVVAAAVGALPGLFMLWTAVSADVDRQGYATDGGPFYAPWLRGAPQSLGSVRMPSFYDTVMSTGVVLAAVGVLVALASLGFAIGWFITRRKMHRLGLGVAMVGAVLVGAAAFVVRGADQEVGEAFAKGSGSELEQLSGSCWFTAWNGDDVPELAQFRADFTQVDNEGRVVVPCSYDRWTDGERSGLGLPPSPDTPFYSTAFFAVDGGEPELLGAVATPFAYVESFSLGADGSVAMTLRISGGPEFGDGSRRVECTRQLQPDQVAEPCR